MKVLTREIAQSGGLSDEVYAENLFRTLSLCVQLGRTEVARGTMRSLEEVLSEESGKWRESKLVIEDLIRRKTEVPTTEKALEDLPEYLADIAAYILASRIQITQLAEIEAVPRDILVETSDYHDPLSRFLMRPLKEANSLSGLSTVYPKHRKYAEHCGEGQEDKDYNPWFVTNEIVSGNKEVGWKIILELIHLNEELHKQRWGIIQLQSVTTKYELPSTQHREYYQKIADTYEELFSYILNAYQAKEIYRAEWIEGAGGTGAWHCTQQ